MQCGIFLGYRTSPGERWNGEYVIADLDNFVNKSLDIDADYAQFQIYPHITKQVKLGLDGVFFPLKQKYDWYNRTLAGREAVAEESDAFKPMKLQRPSNRLDTTSGEPHVTFTTGDIITMSEKEGFDLDGGDVTVATYPGEPPAIDPAGKEETTIRIWSAVARNAHRCRTTMKGGPNWGDVVMRIIRDANTGAELDRLENASAILSKDILYKPIPDGPRDIITELYYRGKPGEGENEISSIVVPKDPTTADVDSPFGYFVDSVGRRYKKDVSGIVIKRSNRPPHIPSQMWCDGGATRLRSRSG
jgi:hypothetical protein